MFVGVNTPIYTGLKAGASANYVTGNLYESTSGNTTGWGSAFNIPYEYKSFLLPASNVKAAVQKLAGANLASPTSCVSPSGILFATNPERTRFLSMRGSFLVAQGYGSDGVEIVVTDVSGAVLERRTFSPADGAAVEMDLSAHAGSGVLLASVRAPGQPVLSTRVQALR